MGSEVKEFYKCGSMHEVVLRTVIWSTNHGIYSCFGPELVGSGSWFTN